MAVNNNSNNMPEPALAQQPQVESLFNCRRRQKRDMADPIPQTLPYTDTAATPRTVSTRGLGRMNILLSLLCFVLASMIQNSAAISVIDSGGSINYLHLAESSSSTTTTTTATTTDGSTDRSIDSVSPIIQPHQRHTSKVTLTVAEQEELRKMYAPQLQQQHHRYERTRFISPPGMGIRQEDLPIDESNEDQWQSLNPLVEFYPSEKVDPAIVQRFLGENNDDSQGAADGAMASIYNFQPFANGDENYDGYQQAWRLLGFIVDCNPLVDDDYYGGSGSGDQYTADACARYVLWAAYVDLEYEGGGIGEYQYYDRYNNKWDATSCQVSGNNRCAKMDCHLENTHFSLLGFFKHKSYDDWMEQLFKHLGMCIWTDEQYSFMKNARKAWPQGCTSSGRTTNDGKTIYYDIKPIRGGDIVVGLYTDTQCVNEYSGGQSSITVDNILGNFLVNGGSGDKNKNNNGGYYDYSYESLSDSYSRWNDAFDAFHICQPCVAYDLQNVYGYTYSDNGDQFDCYDDAGYTNVNQCMKFMAKTRMNTATFRDMSLGRYQGTLVATPLSGFKTKSGSWTRESWSNRLTYLFLAISVIIFLYGFVYYMRVKYEANKFTPTWNAKEPLV